MTSGARFLVRILPNGVEIVNKTNGSTLHKVTRHFKTFAPVILRQLSEKSLKKNDWVGMHSPGILVNSYGVVNDIRLSY